MTWRRQQRGPAATMTPYQHMMLRTEPGWSKLPVEDWQLIERVRRTGKLECGSFGEGLVAQNLPNEGYTEWLPPLVSHANWEERDNLASEQARKDNTKRKNRKYPSNRKSLF